MSILTLDISNRFITIAGMSRIAEALGKNQIIKNAYLGGNFVDYATALELRDLITRKNSLETLVFMYEGIEFYARTYDGSVNAKYETLIQCHSFHTIGAVAGGGELSHCLGNDGYLYSGFLVSIGLDLTIGESYHSFIIKSQQPLNTLGKKSSFKGPMYMGGLLLGRTSVDLKNKSGIAIDWSYVGAFTGIKVSYGKLKLKRGDKHLQRSKYGFGNTLYRYPY